MNCKEVNEIINEVVFDNIEYSGFFEHLNKCEKCSLEYKNTLKLKEELNDFELLELPENFNEEVMIKINAISQYMEKENLIKENNQIEYEQKSIKNSFLNFLENFKIKMGLGLAFSFVLIFSVFVYNIDENNIDINNDMASEKQEVFSIALDETVSNEILNDGVTPEENTFAMKTMMIPEYISFKSTDELSGSYIDYYKEFDQKLNKEYFIINLNKNDLILNLNSEMDYTVDKIIFDEKNIEVISNIENEYLIKLNENSDLTVFEIEIEYHNEFEILSQKIIINKLW